VITGPSSMGKSTIVKLVALQLQKTNDYHILPIMCPKDIVKYFDPNIKEVSKNLSFFQISISFVNDSEKKIG
jgi:ABC-type iron transport system FetAB ATPase subunit